jgi:hypothetical protein
VAIAQLRPGLWRWTAPHPDWRPGAEPGSPADWPEVVGCVVASVAGGVVFIDPLLPPGDPDEFWAATDALVMGADRVAVLNTIQFHRRSRDEFAARYSASTSRARAAVPEGVEPIQIRGAGETMVWLPEHRTLVPGDRLLGDGAGGLRLPPESWLGYLDSGIGTAELRTALAPLLELPVEIVLVSHGEPVQTHGREAIERALRSS